MRNWEWDFDTTSPDVPAMESSLGHYCHRQFMDRRTANGCSLTVDEAACNQEVKAAQARGISNPAPHDASGRPGSGVPTGRSPQAPHHPASMNNGGTHTAQALRW